MKIVSMIKIEGEWLRQETIPREKTKKEIEEALKRAGDAIGAEIQIHPTAMNEKIK